MIIFGGNSLTLWSEVVNSVILGIIIFVPFLVGKDARQNGLPWVETVAWACIATFSFPLGLGLYFWLGRTREEQDPSPPIKNKIN